MYEDWALASEQIKDVKGPRYKRFSTREEAEEFVRTGGKSSGTPAGATASPAAKKLKTGQKDSTVQVYTDGSSRGNGKIGALAGVGVFFGHGDPRYVEYMAMKRRKRGEIIFLFTHHSLEISPNRSGARCKPTSAQNSRRSSARSRSSIPPPT